MTTPTIAAVRQVRVLNSHLQWSHEYGIELEDGRTGRGASPLGETPSIYEAAAAGDDAAGDVLADIRRTLVGANVDQRALDDRLVAQRASWGAAAVYGLSVAFHEATWAGPPEEVTEPSPIVGEVAGGGSHPRSRGPRFLFNVLNGGRHAYTNPIAADISEFLVLALDDDPERAIDGYRQLLDEARRALAAMPERIVNGNRVHDLGPNGNEAGLDLLGQLLDRTNLSDRFAIGVDASAGDWFDGERYDLPVTGRSLERSAAVDWWLSLVERHRLAVIEDPFAERDMACWEALHEARPAHVRILGDNLTSTLPAELEAKAGLVDGVLLKPDQNGTVSGSLEFAALARRSGLEIVASHRSIETDSPFLSHLATRIAADAIKVGPYSDFSSVMRTNELLRTSSPPSTVNRTPPRSRVQTIETVRHTLTAHNAAGIITGRLDEPLSDEGRAMIGAWVAEHGTRSADVVVSSPMRRAIETAELLTGLEATAIVCDERCVERSYGRLEGLDRDAVKAYSDVVEYVEVGGIRHSLNPPDGETFEGVRARAEAFLQRLRQEPGETVIVVSHQVFLQQLHGLLLGVPTIESLGRDIQPLQIDRFEIDDDGLRHHEVVEPGIRRYQSW